MIHADEHGELSEGRSGAGDEGAGSDIAGDGEEAYVVAQAAEIIGISDRQMQRWRERYELHGYDGLMDRRPGRPSGKRVPLAVEQVLGLYREKYFDLNGRLFHEKLSEEHGVELSYT